MKHFSSLGKTWLLDVDGTLVRHNGYLNGQDVLLPGVAEFLRTIPQTDRIILLTSRKKEYKEGLTAFLAAHNLRYNEIIFDLPPGERILINDCKPSGLEMAYAVNKQRDAPLEFEWIIDEKL